MHYLKTTLLIFLISSRLVVYAQILNENIGFENGTWDNEWFLEAPGENRTAEIETDIVRNGNYSLHFQHDIYYRAEIVPEPREDFRLYFGEEYWIGISIYLENWNSLPAGWNTLVQTHTVPQYRDWSNESGYNGWTILTNDNILKFHSDIIDRPYTEIPPCDKAIGPKSWETPVVENEWLDFVINFRHSTEDDGFIKLWYNGELVVNQVGPNIHYLDCDGDPREPFTNFKTGSYKDPNHHTIRSMYVDEIRMAGANSSYADVAPRGGVPSNNPPVLNTISNHTIIEGNSTDVNISANDPDGDDLQFSISPNLNFVTLIDNHNGTAVLRIDAGSGDVGVYNLTVEVTDIKGESDSESFSISIVESGQGNLPPVMTPIEDIQIMEGSNVDFELSANDPDEDNLQFSYTPQLSFASLTDNFDGSGILNLNPGIGDFGIYDLTVIVTDVNGESDSQPVSISVEKIQDNNPPILSALSDVSLTEGNSTTLSLLAIDEEGNNNLKFSISPNDLKFIQLDDHLDGTADLNILPIKGDFGLYDLIIIVKDKSNNHDSENIKIIIDREENGNRIPVLFPICDQLINVGNSLAIPLSAYDADGNPLVYSISPALEFVTLTDYEDGLGTLIVTPEINDIGIYPIAVAVTDSNNGSDSQTFNLLIDNNSNQDNTNIINSGASNAIHSSILMQEDQYYKGGRPHTYHQNVAINGTENDELYRFVRYGNFNYEIPVQENGFYTVRLHFAELTIEDGSIGSRVFNVDIENGQDKLINYDINDDIGPFIAVVKTFTGIEVKDGYLSINLNTVINNAIISGIEIISEKKLVTHIDPKDVSQRISIYPNPSNGIFTIDLESAYNSKGEIPFVIYDIAGKIIRKSSLFKSNNIVDLTGHKHGVYILRIGDFITEKIFIF